MLRSSLTKGAPMSNEAGLLNLQLSVPTEAILAVSPHLDDRVSLRNALSHWRCFGTKSRREASLLLREHQVAVVVSDSALCDGTWKDVLADLKSVPNPPRLIVTSDLADECLWAEVLNYGAYDMLAKPFQPDARTEQSHSGKSQPGKCNGRFRHPCPWKTGILLSCRRIVR